MQCDGHGMLEPAHMAWGPLCPALPTGGFQSAVVEYLHHGTWQTPHSRACFFLLPRDHLLNIY